MDERWVARFGVREADVTGDVHHHRLDVDDVVVPTAIFFVRREVDTDYRVEDAGCVAILKIFGVARLEFIAGSHQSMSSSSM